MNTRNVLILTYYWPPAGGGGVQRWMYFAMYLKEAGFHPTVITVHPDKASYPLLDQSQLDMVRDIETIYTDTLEPLKFYSLLRSGKPKGKIPYGNLGEEKGGFFSKLSAFIRANFFIPDARKGWVKFAVKAAETCLRKKQYDWLITTGPPQSTHLAGLTLSKRHSIRWLADFRDPWSEIYFLQTVKRMNFAKKKDLELERQVIEKADIITTVGPGMGDLLRSKTGQPDKVHVLYNGYDHRIFREIGTVQGKNNEFVISHIGLLGEQQRFDSFIESLKMSGIGPENVKIVLAGSVHESHKQKMETELSGFQVDLHPFLPRKEALTLMKSSQMLILCPPMVGETRLIVSTKTMEYLAAGVPILGIGDSESDAAKLVKQQSMSGFYEPDQFTGMAAFILQTYTNWRSGQVITNDFDPALFSRKTVSMQLADLLLA